MLRASAAIERAGYPTVSIVSTGFLKQAEVVARGLGIDDLKIAHYPGTPMVDGSEELRRKVAEDLLPQIIEGLTSTSTSESKEAADRDPGDVTLVDRSGRSVEMGPAHDIAGADLRRPPP